MRSTCAHEFGHLFGLDDVKTVGKLMGPIDISHPIKASAADELAAVKAIRLECFGFIRAAKHGGTIR